MEVQSQLKYLTAKSGRLRQSHLTGYYLALLTHMAKELDFQFTCTEESPAFLSYWGPVGHAMKIN